MIKLCIVSLPICTAGPLHATEDYLNQAASYLSAGSYEKAILAYELAIKSRQGGAAAYKGLGQTYYQLGDHEIAYDMEKISAAIKAFNQSLALKPGPQVSYLLGMDFLRRVRCQVNFGRNVTEWSGR